MNDPNHHKDKAQQTGKQEQRHNGLTQTSPGAAPAITTTEAAACHHQDDRPCVGIDVDYYQGVIDDPEVSDDRKRELIELIGAIVINFIDIGFGVHPVQLAQDDKAQKPDKLNTPPLQPDFEKENAPERKNDDSHPKTTTHTREDA